MHIVFHDGALVVENQFSNGKDMFKFVEFNVTDGKLKVDLNEDDYQDVIIRVNFDMQSCYESRLLS